MNMYNKCFVKTKVPTKFKNEKVIINGNKFDSKIEAKYYEYLLTIHPKEAIKLQPVFVLQEKFRYRGKGIREITYISDFQVGDTVFDVKGMVMEVYKLKAKIFKHKFPDLTLHVVKYKGGQWVYS